MFIYALCATKDYNNSEHIIRNMMWNISYHRDTLTTTTLLRSRSSSVSIVSDYGLYYRGSILDRGRGFFFWPLRPDRLWGPPSLLSNGYRGPFPGGKARPGRDADRSPPSSAEVNTSRSYTSSPPMCLQACSGSVLPQCYIPMCLSSHMVPSCQFKTSKSWK
jgi:hypothetical protein